jgi:hypothetical protein
MQVVVHIVANSQQAAAQNSPVGKMVFGIKSDEFQNAFPVRRRGSANILFQLFDSGIGDAKIQELRELGHGQGKVDPLLAEVLAQGFGVGWIVS